MVIENKNGANALECDVLVVGAGASGLTAAVSAAESGASVIVIETNYEVGGHAVLSGGVLSLGGGSKFQRIHGIEDSIDHLFSDMTSSGEPEYRFNDRRLVRAFAENSASALDWLLSKGIQLEDRVILISSRGRGAGTTVPRVQFIKWEGGLSEGSPTGANGTGLVKPLERTARKLGVRFIFNFRMAEILRDRAADGRVIGISAKRVEKGMENPLSGQPSFHKEGNLEPERADIKIIAKRGVVLATGGSSSNVHFRRIFDPRLTAEYQVVGEPYSFQDASGEISAMSIGASLWGTANQTMELGTPIVKPITIGCRFGYTLPNINASEIIKKLPESPIFSQLKATGLLVGDYHDLILVNQFGNRFWNEEEGFDVLDPNGNNFYSAALSMNEASRPPDYSAGPVWAIFDSELAVRAGWKLTPPHVDPEGYFFEGETPSELAYKVNEFYGESLMSSDAIESTILRYNRLVDSGVDSDFGKTGLKYRIDTPPFYAAWATPMIHDTRTGLRIDEKCRVLDLNGDVITGLFCCGESAGGMAIHGLGRAIVQGRIAGLHSMD